MPDQNNPALNAAVEDLGYVARNLRSAGLGDAAAIIDRAAAELTTGQAPSTEAAAPVSAAEAPVDETPEGLVPVEELAPMPPTGFNPPPMPAPGPPTPAAMIDALVDEDGDEFEPVTVVISFDPCPDATIEDVRAALDGALEHSALNTDTGEQVTLIGTFRYLNVDPAAGVANVEVTEPGPLPLVEGSVPFAGVATIAGRAVTVTAAVADENGELATIDDAFAAADEFLTELGQTAELLDAELPPAPAAFKVRYTRVDGRPLDDESIRPVLDFASTTLSRFGNLAPVSVTHRADGTVVEYGVVIAGQVSTQHLAIGSIGWGGTADIAGVGAVTAELLRGE